MMTNPSKKADSSAGGKSSSCHFVPRWPGNPYHEELSRHLLAYGVNVKSEDCLKEISKASFDSGDFADIIHIHAVRQFGLAIVDMARFVMFWIRIFRLQSRGVRVVWTIHDSFHHEAAHPKVDLMFSRWLFRRADALIVHSEGAGLAVERQWMVKRDSRMFVIPHGNYIDSYSNEVSREDARNRLAVPPGKLVLLFLGMIRPYKGVTSLIEEFRAISNDKLYLLIAGMPLSQELSDEITAAIGGHSDIHFQPAHVADDEMQVYLNAADAVVFPYKRALTSGALILAMSFGRACVAPKMGALEDTLDAEGGFFYDPSDAGGLRDALESAMLDSSRLVEMGKINLERAKTWPWNEVARMTAEVYQSCRSDGND